MIDTNLFVAQPNSFTQLKNYSTKDTSLINGKAEAKMLRSENTVKLQLLQDKLFAQKKFAILLIFQGMDASGKDSTIKQVMSGVNPQGCKVKSFIAPSLNELQHDFLWRAYKELPERGRIGIFNRSYYEEVITTRVHPKFIINQNIPSIENEKSIDLQFWENRFRSINSMEKHLSTSGTVVLKFYLHLSRVEQKKRLLKRIHNPEKNWKFAMSDINERNHWKSYTEAFEQAINHTSTRHSPWHIIPADNKWYMRTIVSSILVNKMQSLDLRYPKVGRIKAENIEKAKVILENEILD